jgi:hypothetical protein
MTDEGASALVEILDKVEGRSQTHTIETIELKFEKTPDGRSRPP